MCIDFHRNCFEYVEWRMIVLCCHNIHLVHGDIQIQRRFLSFRTEMEEVMIRNERLIQITLEWVL